MAKAKKAKAAPLTAGLELASDPGFSWRHCASDIEFCGVDELATSAYDGRTMHVRRWRLADGAVSFEASFALSQAALDRCSINMQSLDERTLLWIDRDGAPALLDAQTFEVKRAARDDG